MIVPNIWENKIDVPNHQPECVPDHSWDSTNQAASCWMCPRLPWAKCHAKRGALQHPENKDVGHPGRKHTMGVISVIPSLRESCKFWKQKKGITITPILRSRPSRHQFAVTMTPKQSGNLRVLCASVRQSCNTHSINSYTGSTPWNLGLRADAAHIV